MEIIVQKTAAGLLKANRRKIKDQERIFAIETIKEGLQKVQGLFLTIRNCLNRKAVIKWQYAMKTNV